MEPKITGEKPETGEGIGARIRARRKRCGMKQAALAQEAGISAAQLCHLEKNDVKPSIRTLGRLAEALGTTVGRLLETTEETTRLPEAAGTLPGDALASDALAKEGMREEGQVANGENAMATHGGLSPAFRPTPLSERGLRKNEAEIEPVSGMWRVHDARDAAVDRRVRARLKKEMEDWKKVERDAGANGGTTLPLFFPAAEEHGVLLAREVRAAGGLGPAAIVDPTAFLESKGIRVLETKLPAGMDSWSLWDPKDGNAFVFVRKAATPERKRFRTAFELGHLARFVSGGFCPLRDIGSSRKASRAFAAAFLLPEEAVREAAHGLAVGPDDWTWELVLALKARFGVSAETFLYRIEELGMLSHARSQVFRTRLRERYAECRAAGRTNFEPVPDGSVRSRWDLLALRARTRG